MVTYPRQIAMLGSPTGSRPPVILLFEVSLDSNHRYDLVAFYHLRLFSTSEPLIPHLPYSFDICILTSLYFTLSIDMSNFYIEATVMLSEDTATGKHINDYLIIDTLSSSPTSSVYRAEDTRIKSSTVALKLLHTMHLSEQRHQQFLKEVHILKKLKHDHILPILDVGFYETMPYLVTDYAPGGSLRDRVPPQAAHLMPMQETLTILSQVGQALQYAHRMNIIHGNLKPENILFNARNGALLTDFSLVTTMDAFSTDHSHHANSFPYMAPEQFQGWMTEESDQYALGCITYELFTGQVPFLASDFSEIKHKHVTEKPIAPTQLNLLLPISIEEATLKAIQKKSEDRHPGVKDFVSSLSTSTTGHTRTPKPPTADAAAAIPASLASFDQPSSVTGTPKDAE